MDTLNFSELGKQPVSESAPVGADVRDEPEFDLIQVEISKLSSPTASGTLDWARVVQLSAGLLQNKGKDILLACYLAGGLLQTRGLTGLADGLAVVDDLLQQYWDTLFPPLQRIRGRRNALQWLNDWIQRLAIESDWGSLPAQEPALIDTLRLRLEAIDTLLRAKDEDAPSTRPILTLLNTLSLIEQPAPQEEAASPVSDAALESGSSRTSRPTASATTEVKSAADSVLNSADDAETALGQACIRLGEIAAWWLDTDLPNPLGFRLGRIAAWSEVEAAPPATDGQTLIAAPISQLVSALDQLLVNQVDQDLLQFAEAQLAVFPFWLDLNRISAQALQRLGSQFDSAQREVCGATAQLLARLPELSRITFASGMPFADGDTLVWLATLNISSSGDAAASPSGQPDVVTVAVRKARVYAADGDVAAAATELQRVLEQSSAPSQKLTLRIRLCELLFDERPGANLGPFAQAIMTEIDRHDLVHWDPPLALDGMRAAYKVLARDEIDKLAADALLARIVELNAALALTLVS